MASPLAQALMYQQPIAPVPTPTVAPTNVVGAYQIAQDAAEKNYQEQIAAQNAMWGGLAGLGSAGILAFGPKLLGLLGGGSSPYATPVDAGTQAGIGSGGYNFLDAQA